MPTRDLSQPVGCLIPRMEEFTSILRFTLHQVSN